jgi:transcriptional regulator with GAF, ATPase, and Fis domain
LSLLARAWQEGDDLNETLGRIVRNAVELIPGVDEASISVVLNRRQVRSLAPSGELSAMVDAIEEETGEGPCLDAVYQHKTVRVENMETERRWPAFAARAFGAGAGSMLAFQLYVDDENLGTLNLFARNAYAFDDESVRVGLLFAAHAAVAFAQVQKLGRLTQALLSRDLIGQAKGILMERHKITAERAFALLMQESQQTNTKLRNLAEILVREGEMPAAIRRSPVADMAAAILVADAPVGLLTRV